MPPSNLSLDPAANLWSSAGSPNANGFSSGSSPESNNNVYSMNSNIYPTQGIGDVMQPTLSANTPQAGGNAENNAGEVFMGVGSPLPGGVPGWKWTVMNDQK
jgi:hypothetical protein